MCLWCLFLESMGKNGNKESKEGMGWKGRGIRFNGAPERGKMGKWLSRWARSGWMSWEVTDLTLDSVVIVATHSTAPCLSSIINNDMVVMAHSLY